MATSNDANKMELQIPGVDFAEMARQAIAGQLTTALTATPAMIQQIVAGALTRKVDSEGKPSHYHHEQRTFIQWVCEDMIRKAVIEMFQARLQEMRPELEAAVAKEIRKSAPAIAQALVKGYNEGVHSSYNTQVQFTVTPRSRG